MNRPALAFAMVTAGVLSGCTGTFEVALPATPTPAPLVESVSAQALVAGARLEWSAPPGGEALQLVIRERRPKLQPDLQYEQIVIPVSGTTATVTGLSEDVDYSMQLTDVHFQAASAPLNIRTFPSGALEPIPFHVLRDDEPGAGFGAAAIFAGDLDDDGFEDIAVGAPNASDGQPFEGAVYFYSGALVLAGGLPLRIQSDQDLAMLGRYLARGGDLDGDGIDDFVAGAPFPIVVNDTALTPAGVVHVVHGDGTLAPAIGATFTGIPNDLFGSALVAADLDGTPGNELLAGGPGAAYAEVLAGGVTFSAVTSSNSLLGYAVATGDFDGDSLVDIAVGEPLWGEPVDPGDPPDESGQGGPVGDPWHSGRVQIYLADTPGVYPAVPTTLLVGTTAGQMMGTALLATDVNGDGADDLFVGATHCAFPSAAPVITPGAIHLWLGGVSGFAPAADLVLTANTLCLGRSIAAGDVNGDGELDVVAGDSAAGEEGAGEVRVFLGDGDTGLPSLTSSSIFGAPGSGLGVSVAVGNLQGFDLRQEIIAGAPGTGDAPGAVNVYRGASLFGPELGVNPTVISGNTVTPVVSFEPQEGASTTYRCRVSWGDGSPLEEGPCVPGLIPVSPHVYEPGEWVIHIRVMSLTDRYGEAAIRVTVPPT